MIWHCTFLSEYKKIVSDMVFSVPIFRKVGERYGAVCLAIDTSNRNHLLVLHHVRLVQLRLVFPQATAQY